MRGELKFIIPQKVLASVAVPRLVIDSRASSLDGSGDMPSAEMITPKNFIDCALKMHLESPNSDMMICLSQIDCKHGSYLA